MKLTIEFDRETDGRHIAAVPELPGCLAYGETRAEADKRVRALALHILADQAERGERDARDIASAAQALGIVGVEGMDPEDVYWATDVDLWEQIRRSREDPQLVPHEEVLRRLGRRVWLDDVRDAPEGWTRACTAPDAIPLLEASGVVDISLDHDLGDEATCGTGYAVACWIE